MYPTVLQSSDEALRKRICKCLESRSHDRVDAMQIQVKGGVATISGRLDSATDRELWLKYCRHVPGVVRIVDQLQVQP